ncbi:hypothetical protein OF829_19430 [Sphingomonas sp. LB-2]|uniref:hypothetical protein n=1 Tax=Sphingomonas caeni TaxID=2984949 RepID=UPI00223211CA|nr:hypothetical protein [Sphingomonas caeni]MCW3849417.1 hypothetical protein [Sphingomonas caeni]
MVWYEKAGASLLLRVAGVGTLAIAYFAGAALRSRAGTVALNSDPVAYLLAATTFLCASFGSILTVLGKHIFDKVEVSRRWSRADRD